MMKYIARFEKDIPVTISIVELFTSSSVAPCRSANERPIARSCSTSCEACQKNKYGEIVVPIIATNTARYALDHSICGINVDRITAVQSGWARKAAATYANNTSVSHLNTRAMCRYEDQNKSETMRTT